MEGKIYLEKVIFSLQKKTDGSTALYPLIDFKELSRIRSLQKSYE